MASTTQIIIDDLYVNLKDIFITPAISTNMYKEIEKTPDLSKKLDNMAEKHSFRTNVKFYAMNMAMKIFLTHEPSLDSYELYHIYVKNIINVLIKPKIYIQKNSMIK